MGEPTLLDKTFHIIMKRMVETGQAPFYTEIAEELGVSAEEGRKALHDLFSEMIPGWLYPKTDFITSFAPFNNLPTQYRITIDGQQKWFAQWGYESLAVCWLFPGKTVHVDCPCLDCGLRIHLEIKDGDVLVAEPDSIVTYVAVPFWKWYEDLSYAWSTMNLFRSEEHVHNYASFDAATEDGIMPLADAVKLFSIEYFRRRLDPDYFSKRLNYRAEMYAVLKEIGKTGPFWLKPES
jgi:hypothetical protein